MISVISKRLIKATAPEILFFVSLGEAGLYPEPAAEGQRAGSVPCLTAAGRDGVLMPVNKQKNRAEGGEKDAGSGR